MYIKAGTRCTVCRHDLSGMILPTRCPECGGQYVYGQHRRPHKALRTLLIGNVILVLGLLAAFPTSDFGLPSGTLGSTLWIGGTASTTGSACALKSIGYGDRLSPWFVWKVVTGSSCALLVANAVLSNMFV